MICRRCARWMLFGSLGAAAIAQSPDRVLAPSSTITEKLAGGDQLVYRLDLPPNQTLPMQIVERQGTAGVVSILAPDGSELAEADLSLRSPVAKALLIPPGATKIILRPANHSAVERIFEIHTGEYRPLDDPGRLRLAADQLLGQGEHAFTHQVPGFREAAQAAYEKSLELWTRLGDRKREADTLCHLGNIGYELADHQLSTEPYRRALELFTAEGDRPGEAAALFGRARSASVENNLDDAEKWARQGLEILTSLSDAHLQPELMVVIFAVQYVHGKFELSRATLDQAISLARRTGDPVCEGDALNDLGVLESQLGNRDAAVAAYHRALAIDREEQNLVRAAQALSNIATEYGKSGDNREAVRALEEVLPVRNALAPRSSYANTLYNLAVNQKNIGEYEQALDGFRQALEIFRETHGSRGEGFALREIGALYLSTNEPDKAEDFLRQAAAKWRSVSDRHGEVLAMDSLADLALRRGEVSKATDLWTQALATARAAGLQREQEATLIGLARGALQSGNARSALESAAAAKDLAEKIPDQSGKADAIYEQAAAWRQLGDSALARDALKAALALDREAERKANQVEDLKELARLDGSRDEIDEALSLFQTLGPGAERVESRMQFSAAHRDLFDLAIDLHMQAGDTDAGFAFSERARARGLATLLREPAVNVREGADAALLARERDLESSMHSKQEHLAQMLAGPHDASKESAARSDLDRVVGRYRDAEAEIRKNSPRYAALMTPRALSARETQALMPADTALLEFWLGAEHSYAWLVTKTAVQGFQLPSREAIEAVARRAYASVNARNVERDETLAARKQRVSQADREFAQSAAELSRLLLGPIPDLSALRRLWIVSDGALEYLPFAALPLPGTGTPLVAAHEIVRLPSASVMAQMRSEASLRHTAPLSVAVFADPVFRADDERVANITAQRASDPPRAAEDVDLFNLPRLYFSRQEADAIRALGNGRNTREILDFDASRAEAEKPGLRDYRVIHFATHALVDSKNPELSGLVLSMIDRQGRPQDGFLRLHEVYKLKLNADLVVLSACRTALGAEVQSEGLIGLTRGFMYAGAPQVLASLWSIRDNATTWFMGKFYEALLDRHQTPEAALHTAQLAMIKDARWYQPYYWAAFTVQGAR